MSDDSGGGADSSPGSDDAGRGGDDASPFEALLARIRDRRDGESDATTDGTSGQRDVALGDRPASNAGREAGEKSGSRTGPESPGTGGSSFESLLDELPDRRRAGTDADDADTASLDAIDDALDGTTDGTSLDELRRRVDERSGPNPDEDRDADPDSTRDGDSTPGGSAGLDPDSTGGRDPETGAETTGESRASGEATTGGSAPSTDAPEPPTGRPGGGFPADAPTGGGGDAAGEATDKSPADALDGAVDQSPAETGAGEGPPAPDAGLVGAGDSVLLVESLERSKPTHSCRSFFELSGGEPQRVLFVTLTRPAADRLAVLEAFPDPVDAVTVVSGTDQYQSATADGATDAVAAETTVRTVQDPTNLAKLGITISQALSEWEGEETPVSVCVHSLTALLQYAELRLVFRFLHVLQNHLHSVGATAHYHLDADAHDDQTVAMFRSLFDEVVTVGPDGEFRRAGPEIPRE